MVLVYVCLVQLHRLVPADKGKIDPVCANKWKRRARSWYRFERQRLLVFEDVLTNVLTNDVM